MERARWITRVGVLLVFIGFIMPSLLVSCGGFAGAGQSFSLFDLTRMADLPSLYLVPLGALVVLLLSLFGHLISITERTNILIQLVAGMTSLVVALVTVYNLYSKAGETYGIIDISPEFGLFVLVGGYIVIVVGMYMDWTSASSSAMDGYQPPPRPVQIKDRGDPKQYSPPSHPRLAQQQSAQPTPSSNPRAYMDVRIGNTVSQTIQIVSSDFSIGRSSRNDLVIEDTQVSGKHCRLRYAGGKWFLQDQGSTNGTMVNNQPFQAGQINSGDRISLGNTTITFRT